MSCTVLTELPASSQSKSFNFNIDENLRPHYEWNDRFRYEIERMKTFANWPLEWMDKNTLATTGMFYTGSSDKTTCYFCDITIGKWELHDDPVQEHLRWSPNCPLLKRRTTNNIPADEACLGKLLPPAKAGIFDTPPMGKWMTNPLPDYSIEAERLLTFADWPRSMKQKPEQLANAGFYYKGTGDNVICFSCLGGLKDWEEGDDPWEQHALWMGHYCPYVKFAKGEALIKSVVEKFKSKPPQAVPSDEKPNQMVQEGSVDVDECKLCKICFDKECNTAYVPCGHVVACVQCAFAARECPLCRASVDQVVRLYFA